MPRKSNPDFTKDPTPWEVDGLPLEVGDKADWDGTTDSNYNNGCGQCDVPHEIEVKEVNRSSPDDAYYIDSATRSTCCGGIWVSPDTLSRGVGGLPIHLSLLKDVKNKISAGTITQNDLQKKVDEVFGMLAKDHFQSGGKQFKGVCSTCYTDVHVVGGQLQHVDKRVCSTAAVLVST